MAIRTVQFLGMAFGTNQATVTATANGTQFFSGTVPTVDQPLPALPNASLDQDQVILFSLEIDTAFSGEIPVSHTVNSGTVIFGEIYANYIAIPNPVYTAEQMAILISPSYTMSQKTAVWTQVANPPLSAEEIALLSNPATPSSTVNSILDAHGCSLTVSSGASTFGGIDDTDPRGSVYINGVAKTPDHGELPGTWWWTLSAGSTLSFNLQVDPATM